MADPTRFGSDLIRTFRERLGGRLALDKEVAPEPIPLQDRFTDGEVLPDQTGADGVLYFNFAAPVDLVVIRAQGGDARADPFGGDPANARGIFIGADEPTPIVIHTDQVRVWTPLGVVVSVYGLRY